MSSYQASGKPLSAEAQHKQNLRRGVYHPPGTQTYGTSTKSDAASSYKSSSDLLSKEAIWQQNLRRGVYKQPGKSPNEPALLLETSVYHTGDKPLSEAAIYARKLKLGAFQTPGTPMVGVNSTASDAAALLAASADLNVKPSYERSKVAEDAQTAALAARTDLFSSNRAPTLKSELGVSRDSMDASSIYKRASTLSSATSKGIPSRSDVGKSNSFNIQKINQLANKNSTKNLNSRFNPEQDYRHGVKSTPAEFLDQDEEDLAAHGAAASLKHGGSFTNAASAQKRTKTFQAVDVVDAALISAATKKAQERLGSLSAINQVDLRAQAQLYSKALVAAHKRSEERIAESKAGLVDLGGGLKLPITEIDKMATLIVQPVIADIHKKANLQREQDIIDKSKREELQNAHKKYQAEEAERKQKEKQDREREHQERITANENRKRDEDNKFSEYQTGRHGEVNDKTEELKALKEEHAQQKEDLLKEKQEKADQIKEEEEGLINERKEELEQMQSERDEEIKPLLEELEQEESKLNELTEEKTKLTEEVEAAQKLHDENEAKVNELKSKLEQTHTDILQYQTDWEAAQEKREKADREIADLQDSHKKELEEHEESHKDLNTRIADLNKQKESHNLLIEQHKKDILREIDSQVEDEHKINNALPEPLRKEVDESKFRDVGELFGEKRKKEPEAEAETVGKKLKIPDGEPIKGITASAPVKSDSTAQKAATVASQKAEPTTPKKAEAREPKKTEETTPKKPSLNAANKLEVRSPQKYSSLLSSKKEEPAHDGASVASESSKRKGLRSRFSSFTSAFSQKSTNEVPKVGGGASESAAKAEKPSHSDASNFDEDISIKDGKSKKGGLFKEEI